MKAILCRQYNGLEGLTLEQLTPPPLCPNEVRIEIHAAGINFADSLMISGKYQDTPPLPFIPGMEAAGKVIEVGHEVTSIRPGDRVLTLNRYGGYATETVARAGAVISIPDNMEYTQAAAFSLTHGTAHLALCDRGRLRAGETLLVHGAGGGVGLAAVEIGAALGAHVIACAGSDEKLAIARTRGASHLINHHTDDVHARLQDITQGKGINIAFDPVGGDAFRVSLKSMAFEGRILLIGFAGGDIPQIPANHLLVKNVDVIGVFWGAYKHRRPDHLKKSLATVLNWYAEGRLKAPHISHTFPITGVAEAIDTLLNRQSIGKIVVTMHDQGQRDMG